MAFSDPIAELLTRIRNAGSGQHRYVDLDWNRTRQEVVEILKAQGFIENYLVKKEKQIGKMRIFLKYIEGRKPLIRGLKRVSKPGLRKYIGYRELRPFMGGMGISVLSTSQGIMDGVEARKRKVGGEWLCQVW